MRDTLKISLGHFERVRDMWFPHLDIGPNESLAHFLIRLGQENHELRTGHEAMIDAYVTGQWGGRRDAVEMIESSVNAGLTWAEAWRKVRNYVVKTEVVG